MSKVQHCFARIGAAAWLLFLLQSIAASGSAVAAVRAIPLPTARPNMIVMSVEERGCYRITSPASTAVMDFNIGSILLNACSGDTWLLMSGQGSNGSALRWHMIKKVTDEPVSASPSLPPLSRE
ncbi:MAG TPA: hypothetical protein VL305_08835 [Pseudolabrys sp.]|jgi:hypothetical protein|nr:hypothetical protein [Pseudolabrys sp.]